MPSKCRRNSIIRLINSKVNLFVLSMCNKINMLFSLIRRRTCVKKNKKVAKGKWISPLLPITPKLADRVI